MTAAVECSGSFQILSVSSVMIPSTPSEPTSISLMLGPTARREIGRTSSDCPSGSTAFNPTTMSSILP